jgi:hypothetical protein
MLGQLIRPVLDWIIGYIAPYTFTQFRSTSNYSAVAILHTFQFTIAHALGFSVFSSHILATDLSQFYCNLKPHVKSSWHSLIPFLPFLLSHFCLPSPELDPILILHSYFTSLLPFSTTPSCLLSPFVIPQHGPHREHHVYSSVA